MHLTSAHPQRAKTNKLPMLHAVTLRTFPTKTSRVVHSESVFLISYGLQSGRVRERKVTTPDGRGVDWWCLLYMRERANAYICVCIGRIHTTHATVHANLPSKALASARPGVHHAHEHPEHPRSRRRGHAVPRRAAAERPEVPGDPPRLKARRSRSRRRRRGRGRGRGRGGMTWAG